MKKLIKKGQAPEDASAPLPIQKEGLFDMDIDDDIWVDIGLEDDDMEVPRWLGDERVRSGIHTLLLLKRCQEQEDRLKRERCTMQKWFNKKWFILQEAIKKSGKKW